MDLYQIWFDTKPGTRDTEMAEAMTRFLEALKADGRISGWRLLRRKLGFGPRELGEWHVQIEVENLTQLDRAFSMAASRADPMESLHFEANRWATNLTFGLARDFPDPGRVQGQERF